MGYAVVLDADVLNQLTLDRAVVMDVFAEIEADRARPPRTLGEMMAALESLAPHFVARLLEPTET